MDGRVYFDVGGTKFTTTWDTLQNIKGTKLSKLRELNEEHIKSGKTEYFFDRNPAIFGCVLDFHRTGVLHLPDNMCASQIRQELEFWEISAHAVSNCCWKILYSDESTEKTLRMLDIEIPVFSTGRKFIQKTKGLPSLIWDLMEHPASSMLAKVYVAFYLTVVVFSVICDTLIRSGSNLETDSARNISSSGSGPQHLVSSLTTIPISGLVIEVLTNIVFTADIFVRLAVSPSRFKFVKSIINILDFLAVFGFWILVLVALFSHLDVAGSEHVEYGALLTGNILMTLRYIRVLRLAKINRGLMLVLLTLNKSKRTIFLLFALIVINACVFGGIIYCVELNMDFTNVFRAFYWAIITMTTVGYGDFVPSSIAGRIVACFCALSGLFLLAMPIGIIAKNFTFLYTRFRYRECHMNEKIKSYEPFKLSLIPNGHGSVMS